MRIGRFSLVRKKVETLKNYQIQMSHAFVRFGTNKVKLFKKTANSHQLPDFYISTAPKVAYRPRVEHSESASIHMIVHMSIKTGGQISGWRQPLQPQVFAKLPPRNDGVAGLSCRLVRQWSFSKGVRWMRCATDGADRGP